MAGVEFAEHPFHLEAAGLTMMVPVETTTQSNSAGGKAAAKIVPKDATWILNILTPRTSNPDTTSADVCDQLVTEYFKAAGEVYDLKPGEAPDPTKLAGVKGKIIELRKQVNVGSTPGDRVYFSVPGANPKDPNVVQGLTAVKNGVNSFVIFELVTTEPAFERTRKIYETTVATALLEDPALINAQRAAAVAAGVAVFSRLTADDYKQILSQPERWERRYKAATSGADSDAEELGYRRIRTLIGPRSMLDPNRVKPGAGAGDRQEGYILQMDARVRDSGFVVDSTSAFFMTLDRSDEGWTVRNGIRKDKKVDSIIETGARSGMSMSVRVEGSGVQQQVFKPTFSSDGYISRVESWVLPQLLIKTGVSADYAFYTYQSEAGTVHLRRDTLEQPIDKPGLWKLTTRLSEDKPPQVSYFTSKGDLIRTELPDGSIWEPTTFQKLVQLWKSKDLPMGADVK